MEKLLILSEPLETLGNYNGFNDFLDTFVFYKPQNKDSKSSVKKIKAGELKGKFCIFPINKKKDGNLFFIFFY